MYTNTNTTGLIYKDDFFLQIMEKNKNSKALKLRNKGCHKRSAVPRTRAIFLPCCSFMFLLVQMFIVGQIGERAVLADFLTPNYA